jgi:hypothetical protein
VCRRKLISVRSNALTQFEAYEIEASAAGQSRGDSPFSRWGRGAVVARGRLRGQRAECGHLVCRVQALVYALHPAK